MTGIFNIETMRELQLVEYIEKGKNPIIIQERAQNLILKPQNQNYKYFQKQNKNFIIHYNLKI